MEEYENNMFAVKFYVKNHADSKHKYNLLTEEYDARRIIYTCVEIAKKIQENNPFASFGFVGSPTKKELKTTKLKCTKRFRVYNYFATFFFNPENFDHSYDENKSVYIILNKEAVKKDSKILDKIVDMFQAHYDIEGLHASA